MPKSSRRGSRLSRQLPNLDPVDATISRVGSEYVVTPSQEGAAVDEHAAVAAAMAALHNTSAADTEIEVESTAIAPQILDRGGASRC